MDKHERDFRRLVQGVTDYAIFMLDLDGNVATWNVGAQRIKGYAADEIIGRHFSCFYTEEDRQNGKPARALRDARELGHFVDEGQRVRKDGSRFCASVAIDPIRDERGELIGYAKVTRDMTVRRRLEEALRAAREELFQSQKLRAIGNITKGIAHDFNNLLAVIVASVELAQRYAGCDQRAVRVLEKALEAAERAAVMIRHLQAFSRRQPTVPEVVDVGPRLREAAILWDQSMQENVNFIKVDLDVDDGAPPVMVDPREFELAVLNVVMNARDAMPNGGALRVEARAATREELPKGLAGDFVKIVVEDNGEGIPADNLSQVVEPYFTTKDVGKGSGLGLSQADGFARQSGGALVIKSQAGVGTSVTFYLPAAGSQAAPT